MAAFLGIFTILALTALVGSIRRRQAFPAVLLMVVVVILGFSAVITGTQ